MRYENRIGSGQLCNIYCGGLGCLIYDYGCLGFDDGWTRFSIIYPPQCYCIEYLAHALDYLYNVVEPLPIGKYLELCKP